MKKLTLSMLCALLMLGLFAPSADAIPQFQKAFVAKYVDGNSNAEFVAAVKEQKCNVCHIGKSKKDRNRYGAELSKLLDKKEDKENEAKIMASLEKVEPVTLGDTTYGELIKSGELPGGNPPVEAAQ